MTTLTMLDVQELTVPPTLALEVDVAVGPDQTAMAVAMGRAFGALFQAVGRHQLVSTGAPRAIYEAWGAAGTRFTAAIPIQARPTGPLDDNLMVASLPEQQALCFVHHGPYRTLRETYARIDAWLRAKGAITAESDWERYRGMWEEYLGDPSTTPESELVTRIYLPLC